MNQEPGVPESRGQASNPPHGAILRCLLREVKKIKSRERALRATVSGPRVPKFPNDLRSLGAGKKVFGKVYGGPRAPESPDDQEI